MLEHIHFGPGHDQLETKGLLQGEKCFTEGFGVGGGGQRQPHSQVFPGRSTVTRRRAPEARLQAHTRHSSAKIYGPSWGPLDDFSSEIQLESAFG